MKNCKLLSLGVEVGFTKSFLMLMLVLFSLDPVQVKAQNCDLDVSVYATSPSNGTAIVNKVTSARGLHAFWIPYLGTTKDYHFDGDGGTLIQFPDGTAHLTGMMTNEDDSDYQFFVDVWFEGAENWSEWSSHGGQAKGNSTRIQPYYQGWTYYLMDASKNNILTGHGSNLGCDLALTHYPKNEKYGFQIGTGANDKNNEYGASGWYNYSGCSEGKGDINLEMTYSNVLMPTLGGGCENGITNIDAVINSGTAPYQYFWSNGNQTWNTEDLTNVAEGTYVLTVIDANGCSGTTFVAIEGRDICDADGDGAQNDEEGDGDRDGDNIANKDDYDPTGYFYCEATGQIIPGGSVSVTGPGNVTIIQNGSDGFYQFFTDGTAGNYVLNVTPPAGWDLSESCNNSGTIDPTGQSNPYVLGGTEVGASGVLHTGSTCTPFYTTFQLTPGDPFIFANNIPLTNTASTITASSAVTDINCNGQTTGSIDLTVNSPNVLTYAWTGANGFTASTQDLTGLSVGSYTVVISDADDCNADYTATFEVKEGTSLPALVITKGDIVQPQDCEDQGEMSISVSGGSGSDAIQWQKAVGADWESIEGAMSPTLMADPGTYRAMVTDANGCVAVAYSETCEIVSPVNNPLVYTAGAISHPTSCDATGSVSVTISGGTGSYSIQWQEMDNGWMNIDGATDLALTAGPGSYRAILSDDSNCIADVTTAAYVINAVTGASLSYEVTNQTSPLNCEGLGSIQIGVTGGSGTYTYMWEKLDGQIWTAVTGTTATLSASPGTYRAKVMDADDCINDLTTAAIVINPAATASDPTANAPTWTHPTCALASNGSITISGISGTGELSFSWSENLSNDNVTTDATSISATGLGAGTYMFTVSDTDPCTADWTTSITLTEGTAAASDITATLDKVDPSCATGTQGNIALSNISGGNGNLTVTWSNNILSSNTSYEAAAGTANASMLGAGTYTVTISDGDLCTEDYITEVVLNNGTSLPPIAIEGSKSDTDCGGSTGSISITSTTGGSGTYQMTWTKDGSTFSPISNTSLNGLAAGVYVLTVADDNDCTSDATAEFQIQAGTVSPISCDIQVIPECHGASLGSITLNCTGGAAPTYVWLRVDADGSTSPLLGETQPFLNERAGGTYRVVIQDPCLGTSMRDIVISSIQTPDVSCEAVLPTCFGGSDGAINLTVNGNPLTSEATFAWEKTDDLGNVIATTRDLTGVPAGEYKVTVTDGTYCEFTASCITTIAPPANYQPIVQIASKSDDDCATPGTFEGAINVDVSCQDGCFTLAFKWCEIDSQENPIRLLPATEDLSNLTAGTYRLVVTDMEQLGCTQDVTVDVTIGETNTSPAIVDNETIVNECQQDSKGSISLSPSGGSSTGLFTYNWAGPNGAISPTVPSLINNLSAGLYSVTITEIDNNGDEVTCTTPAVFNYEVGNIPPIAAVKTVTDPLCGYDGAIEFTSITGSLGAYTITWLYDSDRDGSFTDESPLVSGSLPSSVAFTDPLNSIAQSKGTSLMAGDYQITIRTEGIPTGFCADTEVINVTLNAPKNYVPISLTNSDTDITCYEARDGKASVTASGGEGTLSYLWQYMDASMTTPWEDLPVGASGQGTNALSDLAPGSYRVIVSDESTCTVDITSTVIEITQPTEVRLGYTTHTGDTSPACREGRDGTIDIATGIDSNCGSPLIYKFYFGASIVEGQVVGGFNYETNNTGTDDGLQAGDYIVTVQDNCPCTDDLVIPVTVGKYLPITVTSTITDISGCSGGTNGSISVTPSGGDEDATCDAFTYSWSGPSTGTESNGGATLSDLASGTYRVTVTSTCAPAGCETDVFTYTVSDIPQLQPIIFSQSKVDETCDGDGDATVTVFNLLGGTGNYVISLDNVVNNTVDASATKLFGNSSGVTFTNLDDGTYEIGIADVDGASLDASTNTCVPDVFGTITVSQGILHVAVNLSCPAKSIATCNASTATVSGISITPAVAGHDYLWNVVENGSETEVKSGSLLNVAATLTNLPAMTDLATGAYTVMVKDVNGCDMESCTFTVCENEFDVTAANTSQPSCDGENGTVDVDFSFSSTCGVTYSYAFYKDNGNGAFDGSDVAQSALQSITGDADGEAGSLNLTTSSPGDYWLVASDLGTTTMNNCDPVVFGPYKILDPANVSAISASQVVTEITCNGANNGTIEVTASGGVGPYSYTWGMGSNLTALPSGVTGQGSNVLSNVAPGTYWLKIQDFSVCSADLVFEVAVVAEPTFFSNLSNTGLTSVKACDGEANGSITISGVSGGNPNYVYTLYNSSSVEVGTVTGNVSAHTFNGLVPGAYTVAVTDQTTCNQDLSIPTTVGNNELTIDHNKVAKVEPTCNGGSDGTINMVSAASGPAGATFEYQFDEVNTPGIERGFSSSPSFTGAFAGNWTVTVRTVQNFCGARLTVSESCTIGEPAPIVVQIIPSALGFTSNIASGGTPTFVYNWIKDNVVFSFNESVNAGLAPGDQIQLNVTDSKGCVGTAYYTQPAATAAGRPALTAYPNPNYGDEITLEYNQEFQFDEEFVIEAVDLRGRPLMQLQSFVLQRADAIVVDISQLNVSDSGYILTVKSQYQVYQSIKVLRKE